MKAAVLSRNKKKLDIISDIKIPDLKKGQVLVEIHFSSLCHSQIMEIDGKRGIDKYLPHMLGHEGSGKVLKIGNGVKNFKENDWVIAGWIKGIGIDAKPAKYFSKGRVINSGQIITFSSHAIISENRLIKLPKKIDLKFAPFFGCAIPTGFGMIVNQIKHKKNKTLCIIGLGGIGFFSLIAASYYDFKSITIIDKDDNKLKIAKKLGAHEVINPNKRKLLNNSYDYCIDTAGKVETIEKSFDLINSKGLAIFCSHPDHSKKVRLNPFDFILGKRLIGSWGGETKLKRDLTKYIKILKKSKIDLNKYFNKTYSLDEINNAVSDFKSGKTLRPIIKVC